MRTEPPLILHVIHHLVTGGMENGLVNLINNLPEFKYRHAIACIEDYSDFRSRIKNPNVEVIALHRSQVGIWRVRQKIFRLCRKLRPHIVHSRNLSGLDALLPARLAGVPHCIHSEHGWDVDNIDGMQWKPALLRRLHVPLVTHYITVSRHLEKFLIDRVGIEASRISQIYNGVDTEKFRPDSQSLSPCLPADFRGDELIVIGTVGRIQPVKDQSTLLRAFSRLVNKHPDLQHQLRLVIVGDGPLLADLRLLAKSLKISELIWFSGHLDAIADVLHLFDIFVLPSLNEGISNTLLEAMASGIPVITTAVGGNIELVEENRCGRFFSPGDVETLSELLFDYCLDAKLRQIHGRAAREIAVDRFSLSAMISRYESLYDHICVPE